MKQYDKAYIKKSTWEFDENDDYVKEGGNRIVDTIETWIFDDEEELNGKIGCYVLHSVKIEETGEEITLHEIQKEESSHKDLYKIEKYSGEATFKHYFPEYFHEETPDIIDYAKIYDIFKLILLGEDLNNFLESFTEEGEGWFWQVNRDGIMYYVWGDGPGYNDLICIYKEKRE